jgi:alanyl-tRNA synthetase
VRRIDAAITGRECLRRSEALRDVVTQVAETLKAQPSELLQKAEGVNAELRGLRRELEQLQDKMRLGEIDGLLAAAQEVGGLKVVTARKDGASADDLRRMGDFIRDRDAGAVAVLASVEGDKITFLAVCGRDAVAKGVKAGDIIRRVTEICGGKGGGKPDSAMGGGRDIAMLDQALAHVGHMVSEKLGL